MTTAPFEVERELLEADVHAFTVNGELDHATAPSLEAPLREAIDEGAEAILIDLSDCRFIDSTGIGVLVQAWRTLGERDHGSSTLAICCLAPEVRKLLELTGLDKQIALSPDRETALAALRG